MKKSVIAVLVAAAVSALCIPVFSGCSAQVGYALKTDESGNCYYSVSAEGFTASLKGEVVIPEEYGEGDRRFPVKEIADQAFSGTGITKVTIPATVEKIGTAAFSYNNNLTEVVFAEDGKLEEISWGSFAYCLNMRTFNVPSSVKTVDGMAFYGCTNLEEVNLSAGMQKINTQAFAECKALASINLPEGFKSIGTAAFYNCTSLKSIILPDGMSDEVEPSLDADGNQITDEEGNPVSVTVPAVGPIAFFGCESLKYAVFGEGITAIPEGLFGSCYALESVYLPASLKEVKGLYATSSIAYGHAFFNTDSFKTVYYAGSQEQWEQIVIDKTVYKEISSNGTFINAEKIFNTKYAG